MKKFVPALDLRQLYERFDSPVTGIDCGERCAPHNPSGKPFCCDICQAVPAAYRQEWAYLKNNTDLWQRWRGDECAVSPQDPHDLRSQMPGHMLLLACKGPDACQRRYRALSCRQFPFFPYVTADYRFIGLVCDEEFERVCWVISHLDQVSNDFRREFVAAYDMLFAVWQDELEAYAVRSEQMRDHFISQRKRIPLLHRNGGAYLLSPASQRLRRVPPDRLPRFIP